MNEPQGKPATRLNRSRLWTAFALTPLLSGFYPAIFLARPSIMLLGFSLAYASALAIGLPLVLWFERSSWRSWWHFAAIGMACAVAVMLIYPLLATAHLQVFGPFAAIGLLLWGGASGVVFWLIGILGETPVTLRSLFDPIVTKP